MSGWKCQRMGEWMWMYDVEGVRVQAGANELRKVEG